MAKQRLYLTKKAVQKTNPCWTEETLDNYRQDYGKDRVPLSHILTDKRLHVAHRRYIFYYFVGLDIVKKLIIKELKLLHGAAERLEIEESQKSVRTLALRIIRKMIKVINSNDLKNPKLDKQISDLLCLAKKGSLYRLPRALAYCRAIFACDRSHRHYFLNAGLLELASIDLNDLCFNAIDEPRHLAAAAKKLKALENRGEIARKSGR